MKNRHLLALAVLVIVMCGCGMNLNREYSSFDEYPFFEGKWNEMDYTPQKTKFMCWSPVAEEVRVLLYSKDKGGAADRMESLSYYQNGMWTGEIKGDLRGMFYTFNVKIDEVWRGDVPGLMAQSTATNSARAAIVDLKHAHPSGWMQERLQTQYSGNQNKIYEMDIEHFSADTAIHYKYRGKYLSLTEDTLHNPLGTSAGIARLKEKGITHVCLKCPIEGSADAESPIVNIHVPESRYASSLHNPEARINEFRQMVMSLHRNGMKVLMDIDFQRMMYAGNTMERMVPGYFTKTLEADTARVFTMLDTDRKMTRKLMLQTLQWWMEEYHIDGFRLLKDSLYDNESIVAMKETISNIHSGGLLMKEADNQYIVPHDSVFFEKETESPDKDKKLQHKGKGKKH